MFDLDWEEMAGTTLWVGVVLLTLLSSQILVIEEARGLVLDGSAFSLFPVHFLLIVQTVLNQAG